MQLPKHSKIDFNAMFGDTWDTWVISDIGENNPRGLPSDMLSTGELVKQSRIFLLWKLLLDVVWGSSQAHVQEVA